MKTCVFISTLLTGLFVSTSFAYDWSANPGDGSPENPYQISEPNQLIAIGSDSTLLKKHFILTHDIIFDPNNNPDHIFDKALIAPDLDPDFIYFQGPVFEGLFNGNRHKLVNLKFISTTNDYLGFFGNIGVDGVAKNLILENVIIEGDENVGGFAGHNNGIVSNVHIICLIKGKRQIGGMIGWNEGLVTKCSSIGMVHCDSASYGVGGLIGLKKGGSLSNCFSEADCIGGHNIGGLVGFKDGGIITSCYAAGSVTGTGSNIGGLVGGIDNGSISYCYSTGLVSGTTAGDGGLVGKSYGTVTTSFWDIETSNQTDSAGGTGKLTTDMQDPNTFLTAGWDFVGEEINGTNNFWRMCVEGVDYPRLSWEFGQNGDFACPDGVGMDDLEALVVAWLTADSNPAFNYAADGSGDGRIDQQDMAILSAHWKE